MTINRALVYRIISSFFIISTLVFSAIFVNEARKEVIVLCGNFSSGVSKHSVIRQLNTGSFLDFKERETTVASVHSEIFVTSLFTLNMITCTVQFNAQDQVLSAKASHRL
jgi:hypothetical protein